MQCWISACVAVVLVGDVSSVIWSSERNGEAMKPEELDLTTAYSAEKMMQESRRFTRSVNPQGIGYIRALTGDRHYHALVHWTGYPSEVLFILTRTNSNFGTTESWLWRSTNYGHDFTNDTVKWYNNTVIEWYYIAPLSEYLIFSDRIHRILWVTENEGENYTAHQLPFRPDNFVFQSRLAPNANSPSLSRYVLGYDSSNRSLFVSTDLGDTWQHLSTNVVRYYWRVLNSSLENNSTVYMEIAVNETHSCLKYSQYPYTITTLFNDSLPHFASNTFVLSNEYMFVQMNTSVSTSSDYNSPLWVSHNRGSFRPAKFPLRTIEKHYAVVDTSEGQVFIGVYHSINNTNLYLSEVEGLNYSLSLTNVISPPEDQWLTAYPRFDVHVVEGIVGTYIANTVDASGIFGATVISYDKGGKWTSLNPPAVDMMNRPIICQQPECSLHLHIQANRTTGYQSILTQDSAIGLIMAAGNLGSSLVNNRDQLRLYFSRDGGFTWLEVDRGRKDFQFAAQGAVVVAINLSQYTSYVRWSCDEGATWEAVPFINSNRTRSIYVVGMLTERGERALHVTVFGIEIPFQEWLVIDLNFTSVLPRQCDAGDFFVWIPTDERPGSRCLLGEVIAYERRRAANCCYVDPEYDRFTIRNTCNCTQEDFECDFGFERIQLNSPCTPQPDFIWPPNQPDDCPEGSSYYITSGYRLVAGDKCTRGEELSFFPLERPCIVAAPQGLSLRTNSSYFTPGTPISFTLTQLLGARIFTIYHWDFNDSTASFNIMGIENGGVQVHEFASPGIYNISIMANNTGGSSSLVYPLLVLDILSSVTILLDFPLYRAIGVPAGVELVFRSQVETAYNTTLIGNLNYVWVFSDGIDSSNTATVTHTFDIPGTYSVSLTVISLSHATNTVSDSIQSIKAIGLIAAVSLVVHDPLLAGEEVNFNSRLTTTDDTTFTGNVNYTWEFGDGSTESSSSSLSHTYLSPGNYSLTLTASNAYSSAMTTRDIYILDQLTRVTIVPPFQMTNDRQVPANHQLLFSSRIVTQFSSSVTGGLTYTWEFGDGNTLQGSTVSHQYTSRGHYTITLQVEGRAGTVNNTLDIVVFEASGIVEIVISDLIQDMYATVLENIRLNVVSREEESDHIIPPDTTFTWQVIHPNASCSLKHLVTTSLSLNMTIRCLGRYNITVMGENNSTATNYFYQRSIMAEYNITASGVSGVPAVVRSGAIVHFTIMPQIANSGSYQGYIHVTINGTNITHINMNSNGKEMLPMQLSRDLTSPIKTVTFNVSNHVSNYILPVKVTMAVRGDYGELRFIMATALLPASYNSSAWKEELQSAIEKLIYNNYLVSYPKSSLDVERIETSIVNDTNNSTQHNILKRSGKEILFVDVDILPQSLKQNDIDEIKNLTKRIHQDSVDRKLSHIIVQNTSIEFSVSLRSQDAISLVYVDVEHKVVNRKLYLGLGVGLGLGLILIFTIAIALCVTVYYYRRSYKRLNVRYSRLRQTPVRFTFNQGGELVEDEDYSPAEEDEDDEDIVGGYSSGDDGVVKMKNM